MHKNQLPLNINWQRFDWPDIEYLLPSKNDNTYDPSVSFKTHFLVKLLNWNGIEHGNYCVKHVHLELVACLKIDLEKNSVFCILRLNVLAISIMHIPFKLLLHHMLLLLAPPCCLCWYLRWHIISIFPETNLLLISKLPITKWCNYD